MNQSLHAFVTAHGIGGCPGTLILVLKLEPSALRADYFYHQTGLLPATIWDRIGATTGVDAGQSSMFLPDSPWHPVWRMIQSQVHGRLSQMAATLGCLEVKAFLHSRPPLRFVEAADGQDPLFGFAASCRDADLASLTTWAKRVRCVELLTRLASFSVWRASFPPVFAPHQCPSTPPASLLIG